MLVFVLSMFLGVAQAQLLQPEVSMLKKVEVSSLRLIGRGIQGTEGTDALALACEHFEYPGEPRDVDCNAVRVIYFKDHGAYQLSIPISSDHESSEVAIQKRVVSRLFGEFVSGLALKGMNKITSASLDQNGWSWSVQPIKVREVDFLRAVSGIHQTLEPRAVRRNYRYVIFPSFNWRLWADERYLDQMTLFL